MNDETMLTNVEARQNVYLKKVYLWMALGLGVTALTAFLTASSKFSASKNAVIASGTVCWQLST